MIPSKLSKINGLFFESYLVLTEKKEIDLGI
jgi:hypothetical protein